MKYDSNNDNSIITQCSAPQTCTIKNSMLILTRWCCTKQNYKKTVFADKIFPDNSPTFAQFTDIFLTEVKFPGTFHVFYTTDDPDNTGLGIQERYLSI